LTEDGDKTLGPTPKCPSLAEHISPAMPLKSLMIPLCIFMHIHSQQWADYPVAALIEMNSRLCFD
jgi:hypothetical protein